MCVYTFVCPYVCMCTRFPVWTYVCVHASVCVSMPSLNVCSKSVLIYTESVYVMCVLNVHVVCAYICAHVLMSAFT